MTGQELCGTDPEQGEHPEGPEQAGEVGLGEPHGAQQGQEPELPWGTPNTAQAGWGWMESSPGQEIGGAGC